jgi:hypothetical protein
MIPQRGRFPLRKILGFAVAAMALSVLPAAGEEQAAPAPTTNDRDVIICKDLATATGTRLGRRKECHTKAEWEARQQEDREMTERQQMRDSRTLPTPGGGGGN